MKSHHCLIAFFFAISVVPLQAQFKWSSDKTVQISIPRPPDVGLTVKRIAFGQPGGECSGELVDRMIMPDFQANHVDVIERQHLDQILAEHNFNQSVYADAASAAKLGKILGPSALVLVSVYSCKSDQQNLFQDQHDYSGAVHRLFISRTRFSLEGSIRIVDLRTGQVLGSHNFQDKPEKQNTADNGQPEFPPADELKDKAMDDVKWQIHDMFFPGVEVKNLIFYDDKDCGLKEAYGLWHRGDPDSALKLLLSGLDQCKSERKKEKALARAYYDVGLGYCLQKDYDKAKEFFGRAMQTKGAEAVAAASDDCGRAQAGTAQVKAYLDRFALIPEPLAIAVASAGVPSPVTGQSTTSTTGTQSGSTAETPSVEERIKKLDGLLKKGLITKKEYDQRKAEILKDI
jgi:tetratricopeptide (TPR) repeat protein